jgi:hypothetical protein
VRYGVNPTTGAVGHALTDNVWYDPAGNVIKSLPSGAKLFVKTVFNGLGQRTKQWRGYDLDETAYANAFNVSDDTIMDQTELAFDAAGKLSVLNHRSSHGRRPGRYDPGRPSCVRSSRFVGMS